MDNIRIYSEAQATGMTAVEEVLEMKVGDIKTISATFTPSYATDRHLTYTSSDETVAAYYKVFIWGADAAPVVSEKQFN